MESTSRDLAETAPAIESEVGLRTRTPLSHSDERSWQYKLGQRNLGAGDKRPVATDREDPSSPTQNRFKRLCTKERGRFVGVTSPTSSYYDTTCGPDHNGDYEVDENGQLGLPKAQSQKPLSTHSMNGNDESINNSTLCSTVTLQSSTANHEEKSRGSSDKMQSAVQSRHFEKSLSGTTQDPQPFSAHHDTNLPVVSSYAPLTPKNRIMRGAGRNSNGSRSGSNQSPPSGSSSKRSDESPSSEAGPKPLGMICWHKANGVGCPGFRSAKTRYLLSDHSMTQKNNFNHILSSPCQRCKIIFYSEEALDAHSGENVSCTPWPKEQPQPANEEICQTGATPGRMNEIQKLLKSIKKEGKILPSECRGKEEELENWVASNLNEYIGESQVTSNDAKLELTRWFIGWYMFFPRSLIPKSPFVATERKKSRGWQLLEPDLLASGLDRAKLLGLRLRYGSITDTVEIEEVQREHEARRMKGQRPGTSTNQPSTPVSNSTVSQSNASPPSQSASVASSNNSRSSNTSVGFVPDDLFLDRQAPSLDEASNQPTMEISRPPISAAPQPTLYSPVQAGPTVSDLENWSDMVSTPENSAASLNTLPLTPGETYTELMEGRYDHYWLPDSDSTVTNMDNDG